MTMVRRISNDERGMTLVLITAGMVAFMAATMLALDVGMFMVARTQAQSAADAGALAGAVALYYDNWDDRSAGGPAVQNAITAATSDANAVMNAKVSVNAGDVTFPAIDRVRVHVHRTAARGNPLLPFLAPMFGIDEVDLGASAVARAAPADAMTCVKPFTIPDKWEERQTPSWDPDDTFDMVDNKGKPLANPDVYVPAGQPGYTGYDAQRDRGTRIVIKAGTGTNLYPSFYYPYAVGGVTGADEYRWNIGNCNTTMMGFGNLLVSEPGNMSGPTRQGVADLIALDAGAYWDTVGNRAVSTVHPSPRIVAIPVFDPVYYDTGKQNGRNADLKVANYIGIFVEGMQGNDVIARITPIGGLMKGNGGGPVPSTAFPRAIVLVQ
jgi:Flp pilus assembly protein TadG